jgi:hypothetical protein
MSAHAQAMLTQAVACFLACELRDGGRVFDGLVASCVLFWVTFFLLLLFQRGHLTRLNRFFLRWGSLPFVFIGTPILTPLVESAVQWILPDNVT